MKIKTILTILAAITFLLSRPFRFRSFITGLIVLLLTIFTLFQNGGRVVKADTSIGNVAAGSFPQAVAVNPVTNKIYLVCL